MARLREACVDGRLGLEEYAERVEVAVSARTRGELAPVTRDLGVASAPPAEITAGRNAVSWMVALLDDDKRAGPWTPAPRTVAVAAVGDCELDLRRAQVSGGEVVVEAYALVGDVRVNVPEGWRVQVDGVALLGDKRCRVAERALVPGAPLVRVRACAVIGDVRVESKP